MQFKILMVCLGNICRSPLAEGILKAKVDPTKVLVESAGTAGYHQGNPPDERSISVAMKNQIDITDQRCRKFVRTDFERYDLIYAMDYSNYHDLLNMADNHSQMGKVRLLLEEIQIDLKEVPDPYYGGPDGFENVFSLIEQACETIADRIQELTDDSQSRNPR